ncbi:MAG: hypothetical protein OHK0046_18070 [Anaerolineae bacterium]
MQPDNCTLSYTTTPIIIPNGITTTLEGKNAVITVSTLNSLFDVSAGGTLIVQDLVIQEAIAASVINNAGELTLQRTRIIGNNSGASAGAAINTSAGSTTTIEASSLSSNTTTGNGGAIENEGELTILNSAISGNTASSGGGIYNLGGTVTIENSSITSNTTTTTGQGGGVYNTGTLTVLNSTIAKNKGGGSDQGNLIEGQGGGIYTTGALTLTQSTVFGNQADTGGGIYAGGAANVEIAFATIVCNQPRVAVAEGDPVLAACEAAPAAKLYGRGGGVSNAGGTVSVYQSIITGNFGKDLDDTNSNTITEEVIAVDCVGTALTSAGYNLLGTDGDANGCTATGTDVIVAAGEDEKDVFYLSGEALPGETQDDNITPVFDLDNHGGPTLILLPREDGPAVDSGDPNPTDAPETDQRGEVQGNNGEVALFRRVAGTAIDMGAVEFQDSRASTFLVNNPADTATLCATGTDCTLRGAVIAANRALPGSVTTITLAAGTYTLDLAGDDDNSLVGDLDIWVGMNFVGAGAGTTIIQTCADVNACTGDHRAFEVFQGSVGFSNLTIQQVRTTDDGGAVYNHNGNVRFSNVALNNNQAASGGAIYNANPGTPDAETPPVTLEIIGSSFANNAATADGGAIYTEGLASLIGAQFVENTAAQHGGALFSSADGSITTSQFSTNEAENGGAVWHDEATLSIDNSILSGNAATANGGALAQDGAAAITNLFQTSITENTAASGAGLFNAAGTIKVLSAFVAENTATGTGGGANNAGNLSMINSTVYGNSATEGSGVYNAGTLALAHTTLSGNTASVSGSLFNTVDGLTTISNTIAAGNEGGAECAGTGTVSSGGFNVFGEGGDAQGCTTKPEDIVLAGAIDTLFETTTPANNGAAAATTLAILLDSPAFSGGDPNFDIEEFASTFTPNDQRGLGFNRQVGQAVDIGAYEIQNIPPETVDDDVTVFEDSNVNINVLANDLDDDLPIVVNEVVVRSVNLFINTPPQKGRLILNSNQTITYIPEVNTPPVNQDESDSFRYDVVDPSGLTSTANVNITIQWVNDPPVAAADNYSTTFRQGLEVTAEEGVLKNDSDTEGESFTAALVEPTSNGTLTLNADGSFVYVPGDVFIGVDVFRYNITDATGAVSATANAFIVVESPGVTGCQINEDVLGDGTGILFPIGALASCNGNPTYYWRQLAGDSSTYSVFLGKPLTPLQLAYETVNAADVCTNGICQIDLTDRVFTAWLANDNYWVWLCREDRPGCESSADPWLAAGPTYFALAVPPGEPVTFLPATDLDSLNPTLNWVLNGDAQNLSWFQLYLAPSDNILAPVYFNWIDREAACGSYASQLCAFALPPEYPLQPGVTYELYVQGWAPAGITGGGIDNSGWAGPETFTIQP